MAKLKYTPDELWAHFSFEIQPSVIMSLRHYGICINATHRGCRGKALSWKQASCGMLNCQSLRNKTDQIIDIITQSKLDIFAMTETWLKPGDTDLMSIRSATPPDFSFHHVPRISDSRGGGVAILCRKQLNFKQCDPLIDVNSFEHIAGVIPFDGTCIRIIVIYRIPPSTVNKLKKTDFIKEFSSLLELVCTFPGKLLILGDFNLHWEDQSCSERNEFKQLLNDFDLHQYVNKATHISNHTLDYVIARPDDHLLKKSTVSDIITDHALILSSLRVKKPHQQKKTCITRPINRIDLNSFQSDIKDQLPNLHETHQPDVLANELARTLQHSLDKHAPAISKTIAERPLVPWFNDEIKSAKNHRRKMDKNWRKNKTLENRNHLTSARNRVCHLIQNAKTTYYNTSIENCRGDQKKLFNIIDNLLHRKVEMQLPSGTTDDIVKSFQNYFITKIVTIRNKITESVQHQPSPTNTLSEQQIQCSFESFSVVNEDEVAKVIKEAKNATCDLDPLPTPLLKKVLPSVISHITKLINASLSTGTVPVCYKHALVKPLIKKPSLPNEIMSNYRPISNLPFLSKILEKIVLKQLMQYMTDNNLQEVMQSAYKPCHSTETALLQIQNDVLKDLGRQNGVILVLLDLSAAFDTIDHNILLEQLSTRLGIHSTALAWFDSYLRRRTNAVAVGNSTSEPTELSFGVPQGSVLGPVLFTIYTMPLSSIIASHGLKYHFYADDTQIYLSFKAQDQSSFDENLLKIENCIVSIKSWMSENMLKLNDDKTEVLFITSPYYQKKLNFRQVKVNQTVITNAQSARNIGVIFDTNMLMKEHVKSVCQKSHFHLRNVGLIRKYLTENACATLIHSLISTRLDYCNSLLSKLPANTIQPLQRVQNTAARIVSLTRKRDHITPVLAALHWLPVKQRIMFKVLIFIFRCIHSTAPSYLSKLIVIAQPKYETRSADHITLEYKTPRNNYSERSFSTYGPMLFNALPSNIREITDFDYFKSAVKTYLFKAAFEKEKNRKNSIFK
jgi:exonuclease III